MPRVRSGVLKTVAPGANIRRRGEDAPPGSIIVESSTRLDARHLAILAASGISSFYARRRVRVGLLSVGDELRASGERLDPGQIHDVNGPMLQALLHEPAVELVDFGLQRDDRAGLASLLHEAAKRVDILVSSGGVSGSDADHVAAAIGDAGGAARTFKLALKPGKPLLAGRIVARTKDGQTQITVLRPAGAARLHPLVLADGFVEIGPERQDIATGEAVDFHAFHASFST